MNIQKKFNWRALTSLCLAFAFVLLALTGIVLYLSPQGRVAHWVDWKILSLDKEEWAGIHITLSLLFIVVAVLHLLFNWKIFLNYLRSKVSSGLNMKRELIAAAVIVLIFAAGTLAGLPPFSFVLNLNTAVKSKWETSLPPAPYAHAEASTLTELANRVGMEPEDLVAQIRGMGHRVPGPDSLVGAVARANGVAPSDLVAGIDFSHGRKGPGTPSATGFASMGLGQRTLGHYCEAYSVSWQQVADELGNRGLNPSKGMTFRQVAGDLGLTPREIHDLLPKSPSQTATD